MNSPDNFYLLPTLTSGLVRSALIPCAHNLPTSQSVLVNN